MAKVRFETEHFEFSHGHKPRGYGYWLIEINDEGILEFTGTITGLKKNLSQLCEKHGFGAPRRARILP